MKKLSPEELLDREMESATPAGCTEAIRGLVCSMNVWARVRKLGLRVEIKQVKDAALPLLDAAEGGSK